MLDGQDLDFFVVDPVDQAVVLHEDLADVVELVLGHDAPALWEERQSIRRLKHPFGKADRLPR